MNPDPHPPSGLNIAIAMSGTVRGCVWFVILLFFLTAPKAVGKPMQELELSQPVLNERTVDSENTTLLCEYIGFQSIFAQDRVYVDGGLQTYAKTVKGQQPTWDSDFPSQLTYINLNKPFNLTANPSNGFDFFTTMDSQDTSRGAVLFGALLGDDYSWVQYGGMFDPVKHQATNKRPKDSSEKFDVTQDPENPSRAWEGDHQFTAPVTLDDGVVSVNITNWVYAGAVANSPGDRKSWWFSGVRGKNWGELVYGGPNAPAGFSNSLITLDLSAQGIPKFSNTTIDIKKTPSRAGASMVFLPVGKEGILVVVGGVNVYDPTWLVPFDLATDRSEAEITSDEDASIEFHRTIDIYDIGNKKWYSQKTTGDIPNLPISVGCAVAASAEDRTSHNIYLYGGHGGLRYSFPGTAGSVTNSKFYVLSLPSFRWIEVLNPDTNKVTPRSLHQCHRVQPDQMLIIGGTKDGNSDGAYDGCSLYPGLAMVFNLNKCEVQEAWDPEVKEDYQVPAQVTKVIGGSGKGGAQKLKPDSGWGEEALGALFADRAAYQNTITPLWSYQSEQPIGTDNPPPGQTDSSTKGGGSSFPSYIPPLLGTLLGLFAIITVLSIILFILRRRKQKRTADTAPSETEGSTVRKNRQTWSWLLGVYGDEKPSRGANRPLGHMRNYSDDLSGTGTGTTFMYGASSHLGSEANRESVMSPISPLTERSDPVMELQGKIIHEMADTSMPQELAGVGYMKDNNSSKTSLKKDGKTVRYDDQQEPRGDDIQEMRPLGHRKMSSLDYPE